MINRCKNCGDICPDFAELCDTCYLLEVEDSAEKLDKLISGEDNSPAWIQL